MKFWSEFKEFAVKGSMIDMAIGIIIGAAFSKIVDSLVKFVLTPPLGYLTGGVDFTDMSWTIQEAVENSNGEVIKQPIIIEYGQFIQSGIDFFIIAMTIFLLIRAINILKQKAEDTEDPSTPTPKDIELLTEIRNLLKSQGQK
ncbi:large-conductance mechanosensitive channel protein MscL [Membranihabitans maritimus]|uniref:large-conductance mechanosensitive channel protein MscL n=1 Tax=Membranihabitans maritimus TaxID=2904244 RepID=UPI001F021F8D|nr:large-conductance mechanosensitive channel protein MscL [Membranihabitans maritimus]